MKKKRFLCDVDSVTADFVEVYLDILRHLNVRSNVTHEDVHLWDVGQALSLTDDVLAAVHEHLYAPGVASSLPVLPGSVEGIAAISAVTDFWFVTSPLNKNPTWEFERRRWISRVHNEELSKRVFSVPKKHIIKGDFFLDDKPSNCLEYAEENPDSVVFLWQTPWAWAHDKTGRPIETELVKMHSRATDLIDLPRVNAPGTVLITKSWEVVRDLVTYHLDF